MKDKIFCVNLHKTWLIILWWIIWRQHSFMYRVKYQCVITVITTISVIIIIVLWYFYKSNLLCLGDLDLELFLLLLRPLDWEEELDEDELDLVELEWDERDWDLDRLDDEELLRLFLLLGDVDPDREDDLDLDLQHEIIFTVPTTKTCQDDRYVLISKTISVCTSIHITGSHNLPNTNMFLVQNRIHTIFWLIGHAQGLLGASFLWVWSHSTKISKWTIVV